MTVQVTDTELQTIVAALRVAADVYNADASRVIENLRISAQFKRQQRAAHRLADRLED